MKIYRIIFFLLSHTFSIHFCCAQNIETLRSQLQQLIKPYHANVGVSIMHFENNDTLTHNNNMHYPTQSVYKFPLALYILHEVENKKFSLDQKIHINKKDLHPNTWSPLQKQYPEGNFDISIAELLNYTVAKSDNNTCDILFALAGGTKTVHDYMHSLGYTNMCIKTTEAEMAVSVDSIQKTNWCTPYEMTRLLHDFYACKHLLPEHRAFLLKLLVESENSDKRIKGLLPASTVVAHKTGTGIKVVNDAGIITLPNGNHVAIAVFIQRSNESFEKDEDLIAQISKTVYDYYNPKLNIKPAIDSLLLPNAPHRFNGTVRIVQNGQTIYSYTNGYANMDKKLALTENDPFIIGSISKQMTAVVILRLVDEGKIDLHVPIKKYLPTLKQSWADTVTVHHLLTHMHGISNENNPLVFKPGSRFNYDLSNPGYRLLSEIAVRVSGKSFPQLCNELFAFCGMKNSFYPGSIKNRLPVQGYVQQSNGKLEPAGKSIHHPAAGGLISTTADLATWNEHLHNGKLLKPETYRAMTSPQPGAVRDHPLFGKTFYGYGITINTETTLQCGQTGLVTGFASMNFYYPKTKTSVIMLENVSEPLTDLKNTFYYHLKVYEYARKMLK